LCVVGRATDPSIDMKILIPSFGASAVLLFAVPESKLSQPRNFVGELVPGWEATLLAVPDRHDQQSTMATPPSCWHACHAANCTVSAVYQLGVLTGSGGQFFSAVVGCVCRDIFPDSVNWVAAPVGVGVAVLVMQITRTVHPPGGP
jgi:CBS-domain-containing membrane protein